MVKGFLGEKVLIWNVIAMSQLILTDLETELCYKSNFVPKFKDVRGIRKNTIPILAPPS